MTIGNEAGARRLVRFDGMPSAKGITDIDAVTDYGGEAWLVFEVKGKGVELTEGQRILAEHFVEMARDSGRFAVFAVVEHGVRDCSKDVMLSRCRVRSVYESRTLSWRPPAEPMDAKELHRRFVNRMTGSKT